MLLVDARFVVASQENLNVFLLLLLVSSFVLADPESSLDINKELPELNVMAILNEKQWREEKSEEDGWRESKNSSGSNSRWGGYSIHEANDDLLTIESHEGLILDSRKAASQFKLRF